MVTPVYKTVSLQEVSIPKNIRSIFALSHKKNNNDGNDNIENKVKNKYEKHLNI